MREKTIETRIRQHVSARGGFCVKLHADAMQGKTTLDLLGGYRGKPFLVEVKRPDGKATTLQQALVRIARRNGFISGIVSSVEEFEALFDGQPD